MAKGSGGGGGGGGRMTPGTIVAYTQTYEKYNTAKLGTMRGDLARRLHGTSSGPQRDKLERRLLAVEGILKKREAKAANPFGSASRSQIRRMSLYD